MTVRYDVDKIEVDGDDSASLKMLDDKVNMMLPLLAIIVMLCNKEHRCSPPVTHPRNGLGFDADADSADAREDDVDAHSDHSDAVQ